MGKIKNMTLWRIMIGVLAVLVTLPVDAAAACPNPDMAALRVLRANGVSLRMGQSQRVQAGGSDTLEACAHLGLSDVPTELFNDAPSMVADLSGMMGLAIEISSTSNCPTALLVQTQNGAWYYDNRGRGVGSPRLMLRRPGTGKIMIWVGTPEGQSCRSRVRLVTYPG